MLVRMKRVVRSLSSPSLRCCALLAILVATSPAVAQTFVRGDANSDGGYDISDAVFSLGSLFVSGAPQPTCADAADSNDDGVFDVSDPVYTLSALFVPGSPAPSAPHPSCGFDPTVDALTCVAGAPTCPDSGALPFTSLLLGISSGVLVEQTVIIREPAVFEALWIAHHSVPGAPVPPTPVIDFDVEMVVALTRPGSPASNYYWITNIELVPGAMVEVTYNHQEPSFCVVESTPSPIHVVRCPAVDGAIVPIENVISGCAAPF